MGGGGSGRYADSSRLRPPSLPSFLLALWTDAAVWTEWGRLHARAVACDARVNRKQDARDFQLFENVDTLLKLEPAVRGWH